MKKIYKYATGDSPPEGAIYLSTIAQTETTKELNVGNDTLTETRKCWFVWHYFLVEVEG